MNILNEVSEQVVRKQAVASENNFYLRINLLKWPFTQEFKSCFNIKWVSFLLPTIFLYLNLINEIKFRSLKPEIWVGGRIFQKLQQQVCNYSISGISFWSRFDFDFRSLQISIRYICACTVISQVLRGKINCF